ncbi:hypothetical protein [Reyranella sp.]|uniref:hypothetical protein n=1 Tax=Reyranella sp. TaxID=1929291 RepID=UPI003D09958A
MSARRAEEFVRFPVRIDRDDVARFAAAVGYGATNQPLVPPTYPVRLLATRPVEDRLARLASAEGGAPVHVGQSFDQSRPLRIGEALEARVLLGFDGEGARRQALLVLELHDAAGSVVSRAESRFVFLRAAAA